MELTPPNKKIMFHYSAWNWCIDNYIVFMLISNLLINCRWDNLNFLYNFILTPLIMFRQYPAEIRSFLQLIEQFIKHYWVSYKVMVDISNSYFRSTMWPYPPYNVWSYFCPGKRACVVSIIPFRSYLMHTLSWSPVRVDKRY